MARPKTPDPRSPRKVPAQERSRSTVTFILEATRRVIAEHGAEGMRIADVAERAGVNVASIYQYFPSREALLAAWEETTFEGVLHAIAERASAIHGQRLPVEAAIFELVSMALGLLAAHARQIPEKDAYASRHVERVAMMERAIEALAAMLSERVEDEPRLADKDLTLCTRIAVQTIVALGHEDDLQTHPGYGRHVAQMITQLYLGPPAAPVTPLANPAS